MNGIPYFKHDSNARRDGKLLELAEKADLSDADAYFRYFSLLEVLCEQDTCTLIKKVAVRVCRREWGVNGPDAQITLDAMIAVGLLEEDSESYFSTGLLKRAEVVLANREYAKRGGEATQRGNASKRMLEANAQANASTDASSNALARVEYSKSREEKSREEPITANASPVFQDEVRVFLEAYPPTLKRQENAVWKQYQIARRTVTAEVLLEGAMQYAQHIADTETTPQFTKSAPKWLEEECWTAVYEKPQEKSLHGNYAPDEVAS